MFFPRRDYKKNFQHFLAKPYAEDLRKKPSLPATDDRLPFVFGYEAHAHLERILSNAAVQVRAQLPLDMWSTRLPQRAILEPAPNLQRHLIKSRARVGDVIKGCHLCSNDACRLHDCMEITDTIASMQTGSAFNIRGSFKCCSSHVIYVITCHKCGLQGVGECSAPLPRLSSYIAAITGGAATDLSCAIHRHFRDSPHDPSDMSFCIVDGIPSRFLAKPALIPAMRVRLEYVWLHRLGASLNKRRFVHHSFSGSLASRAPATDPEDA